MPADGWLAACPELAVVRPREGSSCKSGIGRSYVGEWPEPHEKTRSIVDGALGRVPRMCPEKITKKWKPR